MLKKFVAFLLAAVLVGILPVSAETVQLSRLRETVESDYRRAERYSEKPSLSGYCGYLAGCQLYYRGILTWPLIRNGNAYFDVFQDMHITSGGFHPQAYEAENYTLEQALNAITRDGTRDARNILVGFRSTNTAEGATCGHVVFIYAILDGVVYYTETYTTCFLNAPGQMVQASIHDFAESYSSWSKFQGVIAFGEDGVLKTCRAWPSSIYTEVLVNTDITSEPGGGAVLRRAGPGEHLRTTGLYETPENRFFYQTEENDTVGYISADNTEFLMMNPEDVEYLPEIRKDGMPGGRIQTRYGWMEKLRISAGNYVHDLQQCSDLYNLDSSDFQKMLAGYPAGIEPTLQIRTGSFYIKDGALNWVCQDIGWPTGTGEENSSLHEGWNYSGGRWRFIRNGEPVTGWLIWRGTSYYMDGSGAACTFPRILDRTVCTFSPTGALLNRKPIR